MCLVGWMQYIPCLINVWRNRLIRSPLWHAVFLTLYTTEKVSFMRQLMWQDDLVQVAHFIKHSLARVYDGLETVNI